MKLRAEDMFGPASDVHDPTVPGSGMDRQIVVWVDETADLVALLHVTRDTYPALVPLSSVLAAIDPAASVFEDAARLLPTWANRELDPRDREIRDARMARIRPLVENRPAIFDPIERGRLIARRHDEIGASVTTIKKDLSLYYRNGRCANALLPRFDLCIHSGPRPAIDGAAKRGRPTVNGGPGHANVTEQTKLEFDTATSRERKIAGEAFSIVGAHRRWLAEFCYDRVELDGVPGLELKAKYAHIEPAGYLQFAKWYRETNQSEKTARAVLSDPIFEKDNRPRKSTSTFESMGPGSRFQIDASVLNFALASSLNRHVCVGRPYIYFVRDVWSRYIVGYHLGFQPPSMLTASLALMNAFRSKRATLVRLGLDPDTNSWISDFVCNALMHDGSELTGHWGDWLVGSLRIVFEQTASDRGDLKGAVETLFHWSDIEWSSVVPGRRPTSRYRGRHRTPEDIALAAAGRLDTFYEFEVKLVRFILRWNNRHVLEGYDADRAMVLAGVDRVPHDMLVWGISHHGAPRRFDDDLVRFKLMPRAEVRVYSSGILFQGIYFTCDELLPLQAQAARTGRTPAVTISYDFSAEEVCWHVPEAPNGYIVCRNTNAFRWIKGLTLEEVAAEDDARVKREAKRALEDQAEIAAGLLDANDQREARKGSPAGPTRTKAEARKDKSQAQAAHRRQELADGFAPRVPADGRLAASAPPMPTSNVISFARSTSAAILDNYDSPSIEDIDDVEG